MTVYHYKALTGHGEQTSGSIDAPTRSEAVKQLISAGKTPVSVSSEGLGIAQILSMDLTPEKLSLSGKANFFWHLNAYLEAGLAIDLALDQTARTERKKSVRAAIETAAEDVKSGAALAEALQKAPLSLEAADIALIRIGSVTGNLADILSRLGARYEKRDKRRSTIQAALIYPIILAFTAIAVVTLMMTVVVPEFEPIFAASGQDLPWLTAFVRDTSRGLTEALPWMALAGFTFLGALQIARRRPEERRKLDRLILRLPILGQIFQQAAFLRLAQTLSITLAGGVRLQDALALAQEGEGNTAVSTLIGIASDKVRSGSSLQSALLEAGLASDEQIALVALGEKTGRLADMLDRQAALMEREQTAHFDRIAAVATPILTLAMGGLIGTIVWSVMSAILDINQLV